MNCIECGQPMKQLFSSEYCDCNENDATFEGEPTGFSDSAPTGSGTNIVTVYHNGVTWVQYPGPDPLSVDPTLVKP